MARISRKELKHDEFVETAVDIGQWLEEHWRRVATWAGVVVVAVVVTALVVWSTARARERTRQILAAGMSQYEKALAAEEGVDAELQAALPLFEEAGERAGSAGHVARYYQAATLSRLGRTDEALPLLEGVLAEGLDHPTLAGSAQSLLVTLYQEAGRTDSAIELLQRMVDETEPSNPPDQSLLMLARIQENQGDLAAARVTWQRIVDDYPDSPGAAEAGALLAR